MLKGLGTLSVLYSETFCLPFPQHAETVSWVICYLKMSLDDMLRARIVANRDVVNPNTHEYLRVGFNRLVD